VFKIYINRNACDIGRLHRSTYPERYYSYDFEFKQCTCQKIST